MSMRWTARPCFMALAITLFLVLPFVTIPAHAEETTVAGKGTVSPGFIPPHVILSTQKQPVYPPAAFDARFSGSVVVEMTVFKDGAVGNVEIVECTRPKMGFEEAAIKAVKQWQFVPGMESGEPVDVDTRLKLNFDRVGSGLAATAQVSAGSFTVEKRNRPVAGSTREMAGSSPGSTSK